MKKWEKPQLTIIKRDTQEVLVEACKSAEISFTGTGNVFPHYCSTIPNCGTSSAS